MHRENPFAHNWLARRLLNRSLLPHLSDLEGTVLDLGCGARPYEPEIRRSANFYVGVDWGYSMHEGRPDVVADLNRTLPFADESADHVVSFEVIEHLCEPATMLAEARRVLRAGGTLVLSAPFQWWEHESPWDYQRFTRHGLRHQLQKAGFVVEKLANTSGFWSMWILKLNYQLARLVRGSRLRRRVTHAVLLPFWWTSQSLAPVLDRFWREDRETAGYVVVARKP